MSKKSPKHANKDDDSVIVKIFAKQDLRKIQKIIWPIKKIQKQQKYIKVSNASRTEDTYHKVREVRKKEIKQEYTCP